MQYLYEVSAALEADAEPTVIETALPMLNKILASRSLVLANWDSLAYYSTDLAPLAASGNDLETLKATWQKAIFDAMDDQSLSVAEQLAGLIPTIEFYFENESNTALPDDLKTTVLAATQRADEATETKCRQPDQWRVTGSPLISGSQNTSDN